MDINNRCLDLTLENGTTITVQVTGYHLRFLDKLHTNELGKLYKLGTFKITSHHYNEWKNINTIKYCIGECTVLKDSPPKETPRTITYKIRQDF